MKYKYIIHYSYGETLGRVGCNSIKQAEKIVKAIKHMASKEHDQIAEFEIEEVEL